MRERESEGSDLVRQVLGDEDYGRFLVLTDRDILDRPDDLEINDAFLRRYLALVTLITVHVNHYEESTHGPLEAFLEGIDEACDIVRWFLWNEGIQRVFRAYSTELTDALEHGFSTMEQKIQELRSPGIDQGAVKEHVSALIERLTAEKQPRAEKEEQELLALVDQVAEDGSLDGLCNISPEEPGTLKQVILSIFGPLMNFGSFEYIEGDAESNFWSIVSILAEKDYLSAAQSQQLSDFDEQPYG